MGDGEKLLTYWNSALKALLGFDIFRRVPKKSEILLPSVIINRLCTYVKKSDVLMVTEYLTVLVFCFCLFVCVCVCVCVCVW